MLAPWKVLTAILKWTIVLLILPRYLPRIDLLMINTLSSTATTPASSVYTAPYSSSVVMVVDAEKVANPTDQFEDRKSVV